jgi:hypothetical protein
VDGKEEFGLTFKDEFDKILTTLEVKSNNGSDEGKYLSNARKKRMSKPILFSIGGFDGSYKATNYSVTVDEAKEIARELNRMVEYLEQI